MKNNRIIAAAAALCLAAGAYVPVYGAAPYSPAVTASAAEKAEYTEVSEGFLTCHVYSDHAEIVSCRKITPYDLEIPDEIGGVPVTAIGYCAFENCTDLQTIIIPETVKTIGSRAFKGCLSLSALSFGPDMTSIGSEAFMDCRSLTSFTIPAGITDISDGLFRNCTELSCITISEPGTITRIGRGAFENCFSLTMPVFAEITEAVDDAFCCAGLWLADTTESAVHTESGSLSFVILPDCAVLVKCSTDAEGVIEIPDEIEGKPVRMIDRHAFEKCSSVTKVTIPDTVRCIRDFAFSESGITEPELPDSVVYTGEGAFYGCEALKNVKLPEGLPVISKAMFRECSALFEIALPDGVLAIDEAAFAGCTSLHWVIPPENLAYIGKYAFLGTECLSNTETNAVMNGILISGPNETNYYDSVVIPDGVRRIAPDALNSIKGINIAFPDSLEALDPGAVSESIFLNKAYLPAGAVMHDEPFEMCPGLDEIHYAGTKEQWNELNICNEHCLNGRKVYYNSVFPVITEPETDPTAPAEEEADNGAYTEYTKQNGLRFNIYNDHAELTGYDSSKYNMIWGIYGFLNHLLIPGDIGGIPVTKTAPQALQHFDELRSVTFSENLTEIGDRTFDDCAFLTKIELPGSLRKIGNEAFFACFGLSEISIPEGVTEIGRHAFEHCEGLSVISLPGSVKEIGDRAFEDCVSLDDVYYSGTEEQWEELKASCSKGNEALFEGAKVHFGGTYTEYTSPEGLCFRIHSDHAELTGYDKKIFDVNVRELVIPGEINGIPVTKTAACSLFCLEYLRSVILPENITEISGMSFYDCDSLEKIVLPASLEKVGSNVFYRTSLTDVYYGGTEEQWEELKVSSSEYYNDDLFEDTEVHFIPAEKPGDANLDGKINVADAVTVLQYIGNAEKYPLSETAKKAADCDGEPGITGSDAIMIQKYDAGIIRLFPAENV